MEDLENRPLLQKMLERSSKDWGEAPKYNEEYRKIRWPGIKRTRTEGEDWGGPIKPTWLRSIQSQMARKARGEWNSVRRFRSSKVDTARTFWEDVNLCLRENIPIKTRTFEYKPSDQWMYLLGDKFLKYNLVTGCISHFTYSGNYHKLKGFFLRKYGIRTVKTRKSLTWSIHGRRDQEVDLNEIYEVSNENPNTLSGALLINPSLKHEFDRTTQQRFGNDFDRGAYRIPPDAARGMADILRRTPPTWTNVVQSPAVGMTGINITNFTATGEL